MPEVQTQPTVTSSDGARSTGDRDVPRVIEPATPAEPELLESDLLVEDVSIDGMCGVY